MKEGIVRALSALDPSLTWILLGVALVLIVVAVLAHPAVKLAVLAWVVAP